MKTRPKGKYFSNEREKLAAENIVVRYKERALIKEVALEKEGAAKERSVIALDLRLRAAQDYGIIASAYRFLLRDKEGDEMYEKSEKHLGSVGKDKNQKSKNLDTLIEHRTMGLIRDELKRLEYYDGTP